MEGKRELELDILMEVYNDELFEIAVDNAQYEGVCACEDTGSGDKHYDFDFHEDIEDLFLYALRDGNLFQFDALLMLNDILLNVDIDIANEEMGEEEEPEESMAGVMEKNRDKIFDIAVENADLSGVSAYIDEDGEKKYGFTVHHKVDNAMMKAMASEDFEMLEALLHTNASLLDMEEDGCDRICAECNAQEDEAETYINLDEEITVICREHGPFRVVAQAHLDGVGCPLCDRMKS